MTPPFVIYSIAVSSPITPAEPLPPLPEISRGSLVTVEVRAFRGSAAFCQAGQSARARTLGGSFWELL